MFLKKVYSQENKCYHFYKGNILWVLIITIIIIIIDSIVLMNFIERSFNLFKKKTLIPCEENAFKKNSFTKKRERKLIN